MGKQTKKVIIIGCGIAGPALALFLQRAGFEAEIYEARTRPEGYALSLGSNGMRVLKLLDLSEAAFALGSTIVDCEISTGNGRRLAVLPLAGQGERSLFIARTELIPLMIEQAQRQGIKIATGKKLQAFEQTDGGITATFEDGTTATGDLLIGCDGVHSRTRQLLAPTYPGAIYTGLMNTGGYTDTGHFPPTPGRFHFVGGQQAFFGYHVFNSGQGAWFVNYTRQDEPARNAVPLADGERKQQLLALFSHDQPLIREMISATENIINDFPTYILDPQPIWHKGAVVLLGDAAHAISSSSGQGASLALEDAFMMAKCLRDIPEREVAFATFEHLRRTRTQKMLLQGKNGDRGKYSKGPMQVLMRNIMTSFFLTLFGSPRSVAWIYDYPIDWESHVVPVPTPANASTGH